MMQQIIRKIALFSTLLLLAACQSKKLQNGDIVFQVSQSSQSQAIQLATHSKYSHMGIVYFQGDRPYVYEAVQPVKLTPLNEWVQRGKGQHYIVKRLKNASTVLTPATLQKMKSIGEQYRGKYYDIYFGWSDDRLYCSELVWKIYHEATGIEIGELQKIKDFDLSAQQVRTKIKERYGDHLPTEELVISPAAMFNSDKLVTVYAK